MKIEINLDVNAVLKHKIELYYSLYLDYNANYLISVLNTDKDWNKRKASEYLNKIVAIQSLLNRGVEAWIIAIMIFISGILQSMK